MKSTCVSTSHRMGPLTIASRNELEPRVRTIAPSRLRGGTPVREDDVTREVIGAANQRRADAVRVDRNAAPLELPDLLDVEATRRDDLDALETIAVERVPHPAH